MTKLLIATTVPRTIKAFLLPYSDYFRNKGWQVDAFTGKGLALSEIRGHFDNVWTVKWARNPLNTNNLLGTPRRIQEIVKQNDYDLVHVHTPVSSFVTRYALRNLRRRGKPKVIYTAHGFHFFKGNNPLKNYIFLSLEKIASRWTDHLIVMNQEDYDAANRYRLAQNPSTGVSFLNGIGIDLGAFSPSKVSDLKVSNFRESLGIKKEVLLFVMIAEFNKNKNQKDLLRAFAKLSDERIHLAFAGCGPLEHEVKIEAKKLRFWRNIHFLGRRNDITVILKAARASVLTSKREGLPRVIMESMSMGTPVIASDIRGNRDLLQNGGGLLFPVGEVTTLAKCIQELADSETKAWEMGQRGQNVIKQYSIESLIKNHDELYLSLLRNYPGEQEREL